MDYRTSQNQEQSRTGGSWILVAASACLIYGLSSGIRANYGVMLTAISENSGVSYSSVSFVMAVAQLVVGIVQPLFGVLALRRSNSFVMAIGAILMASGMVAIPFCRSFVSLLFFLGIVLSGGTGAMAFGIIMGAVTPALGEKRAAAVSGFVSASSGLGGTVLSPLMQQLIEHIGLRGMLLVLCIPIAALVAVSLWIGRTEHAHAEADADAEAGPSLFEVFSSAITDRSYLYIFLAFFTCGFHMSIIETHLYSQYVSYGFADSLVALALSAYGIAAMLGCVLTGFLDTRFPNRFVLAGTYGSRVPIVLATLFLPKSVPLLFVTAFLFGLTGNATVPSTSGLITKLHGAQSLGALFGMAFLAHQVGAFFSSWLGGVFVSTTGSYMPIWLVSVCLSAAAALSASHVQEPME